MAWTVLFWNIQGTAKGNVKLEKVVAVINLVKPDIIGFSEVGLAFPYDAFPDYTFQEHAIQDRNDEDTPKGLALGIKNGDLKFKSEFGPVQRSLFTSTNPVSLTRPLLRAWVNDVEVILAHAPSSGGPLGRSTIANIYDYFRDQCRLSRGVYKGIAMGDFNAAFCPYMVSIDEEYEESFPALNLRKKSVYYHAIQTCDPGWDMTQKSGGVLDYIITCDVFGIVDRTHYDAIKVLNESLYLAPWPSRLKTATTRSGLPKDIQALDPSLDSAYGVVKDWLDSGYDHTIGERVDIAGWFIDHRPVIYEIMNAERGPLGARVIQTNIHA